MVRAFATGLLAAFGHSPTITIPGFEGEISLNAADVEKSSLRLVIQSASLSVIDDIREKDRQEIDHTMQEQVLESDAFPEIVYECSRLSASKIGEGEYWIALDGDLTLRGIKRHQVVPARLYLNGERLRAVGDFTVRQSDYEIKPVSAVGGAVKLKDELKLAFDISARKQG
jgi:polyisoprenoid-binding protein YceI